MTIQILNIMLFTEGIRMKNRVIILSVFVCHVMCANAQNSFYEPILIMDEFLIDDWIENNYGVSVRKDEPLKIREKNSVKESANNITEELCNAVIYNLSGQKVLQTEQTEVDVSALPEGMYILRAQTTDGYIYQDKFIKAVR